MRIRFAVQRRPEGIRWLRSDGKPNFSERIRRREGDAKLIARRPVYTTTRNTTIMGAAEDLYRYRVRALPVVVPEIDIVEGMITNMDIVNYLGGGEYYNIVTKRHRDNIYSALLKEYVSSIMNPSPQLVYTWSNLLDIIEAMIVNKIGILPVIDRDGVLWGIISEHDIVHHIAEKYIGRKVEEVMSTNIIAISKDSSIKKASEAMVKYNIRRIPLLEDDTVWGIVTAKDIVGFIGSHNVFKYSSSSSLSEAINLPVNIIASRDIYTINPGADVGEAATIMKEKQISSLFVVDGEKLVGIVTERDVLFAIAITPGSTQR